VHAAILQRSNHFQSRAIPYVTQTTERVATEGALENPSVLRPVKQRSPLLQFLYPFRSLLRVQLRHAPIVNKFAAAHCVSKMGLPTVSGIHVGHRCGNAALSHHCMRFAQQGLAYNTD
jgi:hypothetical protein